MTHPTWCEPCGRYRSLTCTRCVDRARSKVMERLGRLLMLIFLALGFAPGAHAEPGNAPDTRGRFVLVVFGTRTGTWMGSPSQETQERIQPVVIGTFDSFKLCVGAGKELQARINTDGYTLDFSCIAEGRA